MKNSTFSLTYTHTRIYDSFLEDFKKKRFFKKEKKRENWSQYQEE